jgi:hypothetical protein
MTIKMDEPEFTHDCTKCKFLGRTIGGGRMADLYYCESTLSPAMDTLIARYGNDGPEYYSTHPSVARPNGHAELWAARTLWVEMQVKLNS